MGYYPVMLDVRGKRCVVIGGGAVAERKVRGLLAAGADELLVVSPHITQGLGQLHEAGSIRHESREYLDKDLIGASLVIAATNAREANEAVALAGRAAGAWVNVADEAGQGDFVTPAVVRRGELLVAVTTGGASPAFTVRMKRELEALYGEDYGQRLILLRQLRERVLNQETDEARRQAILRLAAEEMAGGIPAELFGNDAIDGWMARLELMVDGRHT
ncbi:bifunctional precorrin-2 dehydrogenase/sirohydrochlorin ferrochelatase [Paenibacillus oenotherae]|uniref:precorrin-2 dehydrogenase n=1 Tax=Paenibacillus oenotherae TaxID=1435645 RepID=A0ABS7D8T5_9BACL|nr:bifunctional precorrin-2 dehydrogenase/sirohydrochlorin ferrochelatase [Paenibacillus oenotherae]MBW7476199.1 bifunctional precorrin-2 dehydrogenase/sirohydrochlorin ferrochelatase [Paenibacillus oenotherae]